ncbi:MAG: DUF1848 domain-containing protein, partial [Oscillospiraceae bacterium]|nr:DUF1848 domain-containing protein [Oscillospiraceae bacterium]
ADCKVGGFPADTQVQARSAVAPKFKAKVIIPAFIELAKQIGSERVIWRYDPIVITPRYDLEYHIGAFTRLCELFAGSTQKCVISFVIAYKSVAKSLHKIGNVEVSVGDKIRLVESLLRIAKDHGITLCACCESAELYQLGVQPIACVDSTMLLKNGKSLPKDKNQREGCNCAVGVDIGAYNSCMNGCRYCYANHIDSVVRENYAGHDVNSEFLIE